MWRRLLLVRALVLVGAALLPSSFTRCLQPALKFNISFHLNLWLLAAVLITWVADRQTWRVHEGGGTWLETDFCARLGR